MKLRNKIYREKNPEKIKLRKKMYQQSPSGKLVTRKQYAKRKQFGFIPLNKPFSDCEGHHFDKERVIYIPEKLHRSIPHNLLKNINMDKINSLAIQFLMEGEYARN